MTTRGVGRLQGNGEYPLFKVAFIANMLHKTLSKCFTTEH